tara:strand:+ start:333 stop:521 length:189 start_codon:yes stop_codon:yes gene_type:complete
MQGLRELREQRLYDKMEYHQKRAESYTPNTAFRLFMAKRHFVKWGKCREKLGMPVEKGFDKK